jgi:hypothetical protein
MKCSKCRAAEGSLRCAAKDDVVVAETMVCDACFNAQLVRFSELQAEFQELLRQGIHPAMADRIMCIRLNVLPRN